MMLQLRTLFFVQNCNYSRSSDSVYIRCAAPQDNMNLQLLLVQGGSQTTLNFLEYTEIKIIYCF